MSLQYCKLKINRPESAQEWMDRLHKKASDFEYHQYNQGLIEQFFHWLDNKSMIGEILMALTALKDINEATSNQILECV